MPDENHESTPELTKRLWLETECSREGRRLAASVLRGWDFTLLFFDYGEDGHVSFISTLTAEALVEAFEALITSWRTGVPRMGVLPNGRAPKDFSRENVEKIQSQVRAPPGVGYSVLLGSGESTVYFATAGRDDAQELIEQELLPRWRNDGRTRR